MKDEDKTKEQLINELVELRQRVAELEVAGTARLRAEEGLRESEEKYRLLVENANEAIVVAQDGMLKFFNPKAMEITGYSQEELASKPFAELIHPDDREMAVELYLKCLKGEETRQIYALRIIDKDGHIKWLESGAVLITWEGRPATLDFISDITERKRAEEALRESQERYRAIFVQAACSIVLVDAETGALVEFNAEAHENLGYTHEEFEKLKIPDFEVIESAEEVARHIERITREGADAFETKHRTKGGEIRDILVSSRAISIRGRDFVQSMWRDITERKQAEEALRRSLEETARTQRLLLALCQAAEAVQRARTPEEVYRTVGDGVTGLGYHATVFTLTDDRAYLALSHLTFEPALLRAAEKLTGLPAQDYRFPLVPGGFYQRIIAEGETFYSMSFTEAMTEALLRPFRPLAGWLASLLGIEQGIFAPLTVGGKTHGLLVVTGIGLTEADVSAVSAFAHQAAIAAENARLYEAERAAREQLRNLASYLQAAREAERTYIAREIHDEFGQALTALKMDLSWLSKRLPADKPHLAEKASAMSDLIDATVQMVQRIATELRPGLLDHLGLTAAIEWQAQEFAERMGMDCELQLSDEDIVLHRDLATAIFRIFQETLTNVARHAEATKIRVELEDSPDEVVLVVLDNGKGITESQVSDPKSLGLIGMRERARVWGGNVAFQNVPGQGTAVTVRVPRTKAKEGGK